MKKNELITFFMLSKEEQNKMISEELSIRFQDKKIAYGKAHLLILNDDGTVSAYGDNSFGQCKVDTWKNIVQIAAGEFFSVGLKSDGTVVAAGNNSYGQCNIDNWRDISDILVVNSMTIGFMSDGEFVVSAKETIAEVKPAPVAANVPAAKSTSAVKNEVSSVQTSYREKEPEKLIYNETFEYRVLSYGNAEIVAYIGKEKKVSVPAMINGHAVKKIGYRAFTGSAIEEVVLPQCLESICEESFSDCRKLVRINLPDSITEIKIGAFSGCRSLKEIVIPNLITRIPIECFYECVNLWKVTIPGSVKSIGKGAFVKCNKLRSVALPAEMRYWDYNGAFEIHTKIL